MRPILLWASVALLLCVSLGNADLVDARKFDDKEQISPMTARSYIAAFKGDEPAQVLVSGKGHACLGLYMFDGNGQCVALDDVTAPQSCDELGVEWIPNASGRYGIVVHNAGPDGNLYRLAIR